MSYDLSKRGEAYEIAYAHLSLLYDCSERYNASLPFADVHIVLTEGSNS
jgi:hypothetical protein